MSRNVLTLDRWQLINALHVAQRRALEDAGSVGSETMRREFHRQAANYEATAALIEAAEDDSVIRLTD